MDDEELTYGCHLLPKYELLAGRYSRMHGDLKHHRHLLRSMYSDPVRAGGSGSDSTLR